MTAHLQKELRALATPAAVVLAATLAGTWGLSGAEVFSTLRGLRGQAGLLAFILGTPFLAALSFGNEFQHRTLVLSMTQPISRASLWLDKWFGLLIVLAIVSGVEVAAQAFQWPGGLTRRTAIVFMLMVACSAPLWTLVARSTIGGMVFTMSGIFVFELALAYAWFRMTGAELDNRMFAAAPALDAARAVYGAGTLWLGWFVFSRFQAVDARFAGRSIGQAHGGWSWLAPRPSGSLANILRKEMMLQRPAFLTGAIFAGAWIVAVGVLASGWIDARVGEVFLPALVGSYMPLVVVLAGVLPVGEETSLGIRAWHLTLPVASRAQWRMKLGVALVTAALLAFAVPWLMTRATSQIVTTRRAAISSVRPCLSRSSPSVSSSRSGRRQCSARR